MLAWLTIVTAPNPAQEKKKGKKSSAESKSDIHILFIGNSYTHRNDLPAMIAALAKAGKERPLIWQKHTHGGYTLEKHWLADKALEKIRSRPWDFVVLQEQSQTPLLNRDSMFRHARLFDAEIKKNGAKTILYMTWARQDTPSDQGALSAAYLGLAKMLKSQIAPVGAAWDAALNRGSNRVLHAKDKSHPNKKGTYLAACVFYATIYGKNPEGLPGRLESKRTGEVLCQLTEEEARPLQAVAWKAVQAIKKKTRANSDFWRNTTRLTIHVAVAHGLASNVHFAR